MKVINIFAGPGAGKSTTAAMLFAKMKMKGYKVELVTEYAKDKVWEKSFGVLDNQLYVFGKQYHKLWRTQNEVDYAIMDSPLAMSLYYGKDCGFAFKQLIVEEHKRWPSLNVWLERVKPYQQYGRYQDEDGAKLVDRDLYTILMGAHIFPELVMGDNNAADKILEILEEAERPSAFSSRNSGSGENRTNA